MSNWTELPEDILGEIAVRLESYGDYVRCRKVCAHWNKSIPRKPMHKKFFRFPWLLLPYNDTSETVRSFFNLYEQKTYHLELPEARGKLLRGSSFGWLFLVGESPTLSLLEPLTLSHIDLPPITTFPGVLDCYDPDRPGQEYTRISEMGDASIYYEDKTWMKELYIRKVVLSSNPSKGSDFVAVAIYGEISQLAYCRRGDKEWKKIPTGDRRCFEDIIFHQEKLYAVNCRGLIVACELKVNSIPIAYEMQENNWPEVSAMGKMFLVPGSSEELIMVERVYDYNYEENSTCYYKTTGFKIYSLNLSQGTWSGRIKSLKENQVLLLGTNSSLAVSSENFPLAIGNRIYYTDDHVEEHCGRTSRGYDIGFYDIENESINGIPGCTLVGLNIWPPPIWILSESFL